MKQIGRLLAHVDPADDYASSKFWGNIEVAEGLGHAVIIVTERSESGTIYQLTAWATPTVTIPT